MVSLMGVGKLAMAGGIAPSPSPISVRCRRNCGVPATLDQPIQAFTLPIDRPISGSDRVHYDSHHR